MRRSATATVFGIGVALHLLVWLTNVGHLRDGTLTCQEADCFLLVALDLPVSLLYVGGSSILVTLGSAVVGTLWWGVLAVVIARAVVRRRGAAR
jgi:hypothetical protein